MQPTKEQIEELRRMFFKKIEDNYSSSEDVFHPADVARVQNNDNWLRRFLTHTDINMTESFNMLWESCEWRKEYGANEISESNVKMEYLIEGMFFPHGKDKNGCTLFVFKSKKHIKGQKDLDELKRCVVYWMERLERMDNGQQVTLFFDMATTGLSNMDMEFTRYLIGLFKHFYPDFLNYILVFEMPWVLNAAFTIIKSWLPAKAVQKIKNINKNNIKDFVNLDQALVCWGGQNTFNFSFVPETRNDDSVATGDNIGNTNIKKVHFADGSPMSEMPFKNKSASDADSCLLISPSEVIVFNKDGNELYGMFTIKNKASDTITYKIKTTSPEKFRVRPSAGCLLSGEQAVVNVTLQPGFQLGGLTRDKFLIMGMTGCGPDLSAQELNEFWKNANDKDIEQHRLRCAGPGSDSTPNGIASGATAGSNQSQLTNLLITVERIGECQAQLHRALRHTQLLSILTLLFTMVIAFLLVRAEYREDSQSCYRPQ